MSLSRITSSRHFGLVLLALVIVLLPLVLPNRFYYNIVILVGLNAIVCVGLNLLIGYAGQISLGHAAFFGLGGYASAILTAKAGWPAWGALLAGAIGVGVLAYSVARPILRLKGHYLAMATLGLGIIISIVLRQEIWLTGGPDGMSVPSFRIMDVRIRGEQTWYWIVGVLLILAIWFAQNIIHSGIGRALRALNTSEVAANASGVDIERYKTLIFVVSAVFAAIAGSATAHFTGFITPVEADFLRSVEFVTMVVLGGMASIWGAVAGAVILTLLPQLLTVFHDYEQLALGAILMAVMIFMPDGLVPTLSRRFGRRSQ